MYQNRISESLIQNFRDTETESTLIQGWWQRETPRRNRAATPTLVSESVDDPRFVQVSQSRCGLEKEGWQALAGTPSRFADSSPQVW